VEVVALEGRLTPVPTGERKSDEERWSIESPPKLSENDAPLRCVVVRGGLIIGVLALLGLAFLAGVLWAGGG